MRTTTVNAPEFLHSAVALHDKASSRWRQQLVELLQKNWQTACEIKTYYGGAPFWRTAPYERSIARPWSSCWWYAVVGGGGGWVIATWPSAWTIGYRGNCFDLIFQLPIVSFFRVVYKSVIPLTIKWLGFVFTHKTKIQCRLRCRTHMTVLRIFYAHLVPRIPKKFYTNIIAPVFSNNIYEINYS